MTSHKGPETRDSAPAPKIGVTIGDPSGIGPEIVAKAISALPSPQAARIVVFGEEFILSQQWDADDAHPIQTPTIISSETLVPSEVVPGAPSPATAAAQIEYLRVAVDAAKRGEIAGLVTAPISKSQAQSAGFSFPGHTEFLCHEFGVPRVAMMFAGPSLKVVLATVHEALADVPRVLTSERVCHAIELAAHAMRSDFGVEKPRIGVLGLNPHAGEEGRFGEEELCVIRPAISAAAKTLAGSATIEGPLVPDAAFRMSFDCFVAMYHDQGLIPVKLVDFEESVNTTLGLPIVRTSPDHGVAYDIAGQGVARATSMQAALELAFRLVDQRETRRASVS